MPPAWDVVGIGENSIDYVYRLPHFPKGGAAGTKLQIAGQAVSPGGQVATTLCACAAMGLRPQYVGTFGNDDNGERIRRELTRRGVGVGHSLSRNAPNRHAVILVDEREGERIVLWHRDAALAMRPDEIPKDLIASTRVLHVDDLDDDTAIAAARMAQASGAIVTSDIDRCTERTGELLSLVTVAILGEHVPGALTGEPDHEKALRKLRQRCQGWLCVTRGARGALMLEHEHLHDIPAFPVAAVDTTGAGDVFRGAFIVAMLRGDGPEAVLRFACAAAAMSCTRPGAIESVPILDEVERLLAS